MTNLIHCHDLGDEFGHFPHKFTHITADAFLARMERVGRVRGSDKDDKDDEEADRPPSKKGNPRRLSKKDRLAARALGRLAR